jgi:polyhydroxybutyrate depolymerase
MTPRRAPIVVFLVLSLPLALAAIEATSYYTVNRNTASLVSSGVERDYLLYVPQSYNPATPAPLVISMHGASVWPAAQRDISRWNAVADVHGFIVVYPAGRGTPSSWEMTSDSEDVRFIADLIDTLSASFSIDPARIYADGLSNGGGMAFVASCMLPDRIAAVGMVASALLQPFAWCTEQRPKPLMIFHGDNDTTAPYHGGTSWVVPYLIPGVPAFVGSWSRRNGCSPTPRDVRIAADVTRRTYSACAEDADVVLYTIHNGGHTWPGGGEAPEWFMGRTTHSVNASRELWNFFREHPLHR